MLFARLPAVQKWNATEPAMTVNGQLCVSAYYQFWVSLASQITVLSLYGLFSYSTACDCEEGTYR